MKNKIADGKTGRHTATATLPAGALVLHGDKVGVLVAPLANGETGVVDLEGGVYRFPNTVSGDKNKGVAVYLPTAKIATGTDGSDLTFTDAGTDVQVGTLEEKALNGATSIVVRLAATTLGKDGNAGADGDDGDDGASIVWKGKLAEAPAAPEELWMYYNTGDNKLYIYDGAKWDVMVDFGALGG